jgi:hypothetical protein
MLVLNVIVSTPRNAGIGLGIVALGLPVYVFWSLRNKQSIQEKSDVINIQ